MSSGIKVLSGFIFLQRAGNGKSPVLLLSPLEELSGGDSDEELGDSDELLGDSDEELGDSDEELGDSDELLVVVDERPASGSVVEELLTTIPLEEPSG